MTAQNSKLSQILATTPYWPDEYPKREKLDFSNFISVTRDLTPNFIPINCIQKVYDSPLHDSMWKAYFLRVQQQKPGYNR